MSIQGILDAQQRLVILRSLLDIGGAANESILNDFATTGILRDPSHPDKLPVGFAKVEGGPSSPAMVGFTCAFCHTTEFRYKNKKNENAL